MRIMDIDKNSSDIKFSVIIPHYNIPDLLMRCLGSIPTREDIQVIVVDDCSPDFESYKSKYSTLSRPYLELYRTPIGGSAGRARNIGIEKAKGEWLIFLDADDLFVENVENLLNDAVGRNEDVLFFSYKSVYSDDLNKPAGRNFYFETFQRYKETGDESELRYKFEALWGKIIKRSLVDDHHIRFDETRYGNDVNFSAQCGLYANSIKVFDQELFIITQREGSLASSQFKECTRSYEEMYSRTWVSTRMINLLHKVYPQCKETWMGLSFLKNYPIKSIPYLLSVFLRHPMFIAVFVTILLKRAESTFNK